MSTPYEPRMKISIHLAILALFATALIGCAREQGTAAEQAAPAADATAAESAPVETGKQLKKPLAKNVELRFPYELQRDRTAEGKPGVYQRRVLLEYLGLDQHEAAGAIRADLAAGGYTLDAERQLEDGRTHMTFKKGKQKVTVLVRQGGKLQNTRASGAILVVLPAKAPKPKAE